MSIYTKELEYILKSEDIPISKTEKYEEKINKIKSSMDKKLIFLADYDDTFSRRIYKNNRVAVSYRVVTNSNLVSEDLKNRAKYLVKTYEPYERNTALDFNERDSKMHEYYEHTLVAFSEQKFNRKIFRSFIEEIIDEELFCFRNGVKFYFSLLKKYNLTLILISAGIYEIIEEELKMLLGDEDYNYLIEHQLLIILANKLTYDENNDSNGYIKPFIYTFNKNYFVNQEIIKLNLKDENYNVIFFGDHLNDIDSASDLKSISTVGIAFGNYSKDKLDAEFYKKYDIVIEGDGDFWFINNLIDELMKN